MAHVPIRIDSRIRIPLSAISEGLARTLREATTHKNPEYAKKRAMGLNVYSVPPTIDTWRLEDRGHTLTLPTGAMTRAREAFRQAGVEIKITDDRTEGAATIGKALTYIGHKLRPDQVEMVNSAFAKERCVIRAATGGGKTEAAFALAAKIGLNTLVILPNAKLLVQWQKRALKALGLKPDQVGIIRGDKRKLRALTLATQQTLWSRKVDDELKDFFGAIILDEVHHAAARTFMETIDAFPARYRVGFSADERRKDRKEFIVYDIVGQVAHEVTREQAEASGAIVDVHVKVILTDFEYGQWSEDHDFNAMLNLMTVNDERNDVGIQTVLDEVKGGEQVIVLTHRREHARTLDREFTSRGISSGCLLGAQERGDEEEFERMTKALLNGSARVGVGTYQALGEGIDLPAVSVGIAMTPISTNQQLTNQVRGRLCRASDATGKTMGTLYVLHDPRVFDERVLRNIIAWNRTTSVLFKGKWIEGKAYLKTLAPPKKAQWWKWRAS